MEKQMKAVWAILAMLTLWITIDTVKTNVSVANQKGTDQVVAHLLDRVIALELQEEEQEVEEVNEPLTFNSLLFEEAFALERSRYGSGKIFTWRGKEYTTDYLEEAPVYTNAVVGGWVLNGNDADDWCPTNDRDVCGVCGGDSESIWYADRDGDGLGDSSTMMISCEQPTASVE